ncbi:MAG: spore germination protein [Clostridiaceae bacterium]|nr:spore germination protein [Clostridiaceae bacterium]
MLTPGLYIAIFIWNIIIIIFSSVLGLPGFFTDFVIFCAHVSGLTSCEYPYMYTLGTLKTFKYKDLFIRGNIEEFNQNIFKN